MGVLPPLLLSWGSIQGSSVWGDQSKVLEGPQEGSLGQGGRGTELGLGRCCELDCVLGSRGWR